jgi:hypothetical protein
MRDTERKEEAQLDPLAAEALELARLPPPTEPELRALAAARDGALQAWNRSRARRHLWRRGAAGFLAAAAAAAALALAPRVLHKTTGVAQPAAAAAWQAPDLDEVWKKAGMAMADQDVDDAGAPADALFAEPEM